MSERKTGNHKWQSPRPGLVVGYKKDAADGIWRLVGVVVYEPTSAALRGVHLRDFTDYRPEAGPFCSTEAPPSQEKVAGWWAAVDHQFATIDRIAEQVRKTQTAVSSAIEREAAGTAPTADNIRKQDDETHDEFLWRIARIWERLKAGGSKTPAKDMARIGGVKPGTMAKWVHEARAMGYLTVPTRRKQ